MLKVFICEDDNNQREIFNTYVSNYLMIMNYDATLFLSTENPLDILKIDKKDIIDGLFFIDVDLNSELTGIELALEIKNISPNARIVFITSHAELSYLTFIYKVEAMDYIIKTGALDIKKRMYECIDISLQRLKKNSTNSDNKILIYSDERTISLNVEDVLFFETTDIPHKLRVYCLNRIVEFYDNIKNCESMSPYFLRCHKSYVVNLINISEINKPNRMSILKNGQECPISVRYLKSISNQFESKTQTN